MTLLQFFGFCKYCLTLFGVFITSIAAFGGEREVTVLNSKDSIELAGTLLIPDNCPAKGVLIMATGSGQQNRDEEILGHKPFRTIAEFLAAKGYASLRLDDRGVGGSKGDFAVSSTPDFVDDIEAAIAFTNNELPGVPVGILGHSQGGLVGIITAAANPECKFLVTIGAPAWQGDSIIMSQARAMSKKLTGKWDGESKQRRYLDVVKAEIPSSQTKTALKIMLMSDLGEMAKMPGVEAQIDRQIEGMLSPDYRWLMRYNPAQDIKTVTVPWLAIKGELDLQVLPENLETIKQLNPTACTLLLKGHNHLLQRCKTGLPMEYAQINEDISQEALQAIADWLDDNCKSF